MNNKIKIGVITIISILLISILFIVSYFSNEVKGMEKSEKTSKKVIKKKKVKKEEKKKIFFVDVKGAVNNPGVYPIEEGLRVNDAINISGGILENADTSILNLSKKVEDEMIIIVYTKYELEEYKRKLLEMNEINNAKEEEENICPDSSNGACIKNSSSSKKEKDDNKVTTEETGELISINTASKEELMKINGIGEGKAESIIKYREENGNFKLIEDIKNVSGIGDSIYEKIKDHIKL